MVIAIVGPTCTGKTALSLELAKRFALEVVACDSRTIYRYMDIGTAKPSRKERDEVAHHMIDIANPDQTYTAGMYREDGTKAIGEILERKAVPVVCGGTGFYARALLEGLEIPRVPPQKEIRESLADLADREGNEALHRKLEDLDPVSAARINVNDRFRLVRALEVSIAGGEPFSKLAKKVSPGWNTIWVGLKMEDRSRLRQTIRKRFLKQMSEGMLEEVRFLLEKFGPCRSVLNTVNYKQLSAYLAGEISMAQVEEDAIRHNLQLARRQLMWFRANPDINWFSVDSMTRDDLLTDVANLVESRLHASNHR